jgi:hypothetical protein
MGHPEAASTEAHQTMSRHIRPTGCSKKLHRGAGLSLQLPKWCRVKEHRGWLQQHAARAHQRLNCCNTINGTMQPFELQLHSFILLDPVLAGAEGAQHAHCGFEYSCKQDQLRAVGGQCLYLVLSRNLFI